MSWISGECQGDRRYECTYEDPRTFEQWCRDSDNPCLSADDGGFLLKQVDHQAGGGGW
jgi:hypothetical protein